MIYPTCPTCGFAIALVAEKFENEKNKICNNPNLNDKQQNEEIHKMIQSLGLRRYCCKMRLLTCVDLAKEIQAPKK